MAALAGPAEASSPAETPSEQAATSSAQATVLRCRAGAQEHGIFGLVTVK